MASNYLIGSGSRCFAGKQAEWGTAVAGDTLVNMTSESIAVTVSKEAEANLLSSKTATDADLTGVTVAGGISTLLRPEMADWLFEVAMGKGASGVYTLAEPDDDLPVSTIVLERGSICKKYADMTVSSLSIRANAQSTVTADIQFAGVKEETGTAPTVASYVKKSYKCIDAHLKYKNTVEGATNEQPIETLSFTISNGLQNGPKTYQSGLYAGRPIKGQRSVSINFTLPYSVDVDTFKESYLTSDNTVAMELQFSNGTAGETITVEFPAVAVNGVNGNVNGNGYIDGSISGYATSKGNQEPITITVAHA